MAMFHSDSSTQSANGGHRFTPAEAISPRNRPSPNDPPHQEMDHLRAERPPLKSANRPGNTTSANGIHATDDPAEPVPLTEHEELAVLRAENMQLRARVEELEQILEATTDQTDQMWSEQQKEFEMLLEEKSEVIRALHLELQGMREQMSGQEDGMPRNRAANKGNSAHVQSELLALKAELEEQRIQLEADEQAVMEQMRQMELSMSKERVELARQRSELQRLHQDLQHEIEQSQKDGGLRERLMAMQQRRPQELVPTPAQNPQKPPARRALPTQAALTEPDAEGKPSRPSSGFIRRLFG